MDLALNNLQRLICHKTQTTNLPKESRRIQRPKRYVSTSNNKDEDESPKNNTQNIAHQASSQKFRQSNM